MNHGSLFSGGGGFDLAAELIGWNNIFHCEWNPFCQTILKHYWPNALQFKNIREFDGRKFKGKIGIITGGFPCQPFSIAGKRRGTEDHRYLWPEMLRVIGEIQPRWVVGENVHGLINWNEGMVFDQVQFDLEAKGYQVQPYLLPAAGINAPHQRYRVWFVAYAPHNIQSKQEFRNNTGRKEKNVQDRENLFHGLTRSGITEHAATSGRFGKIGSDTWNSFPNEYPVYCGNDGLPAGLHGITFSNWRNESARALGNAIVPQVALQLFKVINLIEKGEMQFK